MKKILFARLTKIDEEKQEVTGLATEEVVDCAQEVCDYETSKPFFEAWSQHASDISGGESLGNLREMHSLIAAGKLKAIEFDDAAKQIRITAKVVDASSWLKVKERVLIGFSIGGHYVKTWKDKYIKGVTRFTADPSEISLVDLPCVPTAIISSFKAAKCELVKADGSTEILDNPTPRTPASVPPATKCQCKPAAAEKSPSPWRLIVAAAKRNEVAPRQVDVAKSMYDIGMLARLLVDIQYLMQNTEYEAIYEEDENDAMLAEGMHEWLADGVLILKDLVDEETEELLAASKAAEGEGMDTNEIEKKKASLAGHMKKMADHCEKMAACYAAKAEHHEEMSGFHKDQMDTSQEGFKEIHKASMKDHKFHKSQADKMHGHMAKLAEGYGHAAAALEAATPTEKTAATAAAASPAAKAAGAEGKDEKIVTTPTDKEEVIKGVTADEMNKAITDGQKPLLDALAALTASMTAMAPMTAEKLGEVVKAQVDAALAAQVATPSGITLIPRAPGSGIGKAAGAAGAPEGTVSDSDFGL